LDLYGNRYEWRFIDDKGATRDAGVQLCRETATV
jgi:hypothetical protein